MTLWNLKLALAFLQAVSPHYQKSYDKNFKYLKNNKSFLTWNKKHFSSFLMATEENKTKFFGRLEIDFNWSIRASQK